MNKIALGTAQFGMKYGISNFSKELSNYEIKKILKLSEQKNIDLLDTAMGYGFSEEKIGLNDKNNFKIITKLPSLNHEIKDVKEWIKQKVNQSLKNLKRQKIYGLLFHDPSMLLRKDGEQIYQIVSNLKEEGIIEKIGISIYSPNILDNLIPKYKIDIVQAPFNLLDRRLLNSGWMKELDNQNIEIHARSIFLQGLLLIPPKEIPKNFKKWINLFENLERWTNENKLKLIEACLLFVSSFDKFKKIIIGVDNFEQLKEILNTPLESKSLKFPEISCEDQALINPSNWTNK